MPFSRARYVTLCQQSLVTAVVLVVGLSAAGVRTLDIVPQPGPLTGARGPSGPALGPGGLQGRQELVHRRAPRPSVVDTAPVTPTVREVPVSGIAARSRAATHRPASAAHAPSSAAAPSAGRRTTGRAAGRATAHRLVALSAPQRVHGYATVGVTWKHGVTYPGHELSVQVRTEKAGTWSHWLSMSHNSEDGPDAASSQDAGPKSRPGTDALVIGAVDRVQMRASTVDGSVPPQLELAIIDPGTGRMTKQAPAIDTAALPAPSNGGSSAGADTSTGSSSAAPGTVPTTDANGNAADTVALSAMKLSPKPYIYSRAQWGANEHLRDQTPPSYGTVEAGFIHHTVNANNYTRADVPALLRGIYAYHTQSRGWRDIGYNYLVDRFGRIWEGRYGGVDRAVVGAHTLGYNEVSFAMSAIGNFDIANPPAAVIAAYARLFAWKLSLYNIRANNPHVWVKDRWLQAINGHRDVGQTACPGRYLYAKIPQVRVLARRIQLAAQNGGTPPPPPPPPPPPTTFTSPTQTPRAATPQPAITFPHGTDLAGSADPDLVVRSRRTGAVRVLPTGGQTGFLGAQTTPGHWYTMNLVSAVGDVTGDGRGDVLARLASDGTTRVYRGDGAGHVAVPGVDATIRFRAADLVVAAGDWNRDGHNDVLMRTAQSGSLYLVPGAGDGTFRRPQLLSRSWAGYSSTAVAGDLTGDGRPDLVGVAGGVLYVFPVTSAGTLGPREARQTVGSQYDAVVGGAHGIDGDATGDLVARSARTGQLAVLTGRTSGAFGPSLGWFFGAEHLRQLSAGQLAGSAEPDVVGVNARGTRLVVLPSNGRTNSGRVLRTNLRVPTATQVLSVGDWNRDGHGDVVTRQGNGDTLVLRPGLGDGTFGSGVVMARGWRTFTHLSAVGDVTGDGFPDLIGSTASGPVTEFPGNGHTGFLAPILAPATMQTFNQIGHGSWRPGGLPGSALLSSDGSFVPFAGTSAGDLSRYDWVIGPGDVDGNGVNDLVVRDSAGTLWLLPGTSTGYLSPRFLAAGYGGYDLGG